MLSWHAELEPSCWHAGDKPAVALSSDEQEANKEPQPAASQLPLLISRRRKDSCMPGRRPGTRLAPAALAAAVAARAMPAEPAEPAVPDATSAPASETTPAVQADRAVHATPALVSAEPAAPAAPAAPATSPTEPQQTPEESAAAPAVPAVSPAACAVPAVPAAPAAPAASDAPAASAPPPALQKESNSLSPPENSPASSEQPPQLSAQAPAAIVDAEESISLAIFGRPQLPISLGAFHAPEPNSLAHVRKERDNPTAAVPAYGQKRTSAKDEEASEQQEAQVAGTKAPEQMEPAAGAVEAPEQLPVASAATEQAELAPEQQQWQPPANAIVTPELQLLPAAVVETPEQQQQLPAAMVDATEQQPILAAAAETAPGEQPGLAAAAGTAPGEPLPQDAPGQVDMHASLPPEGFAPPSDVGDDETTKTLSATIMAWAPDVQDNPDAQDDRASAAAKAAAIEGMRAALEADTAASLKSGPLTKARNRPMKETALDAQMLEARLTMRIAALMKHLPSTSAEQEQIMNGVPITESGSPSSPSASQDGSASLRSDGGQTGKKPGSQSPSRMSGSMRITSAMRASSGTMRSTRGSSQSPSSKLRPLRQWK